MGLTEQEAAELHTELKGLVERWVGRTRGQSGGGRRTYLLFSILQPYPEE